jgi:multisubunit Na+/H+ antiporter MnhG subunit
MDAAQIKSLIRHALTAIGTLLVLTGLNGFLPLVDLLTENLDATFQAVEVLGGVIVAVFGFFRNKERFEQVKES